MNNVLFLASKSESRQQLLREAHIPFKVVKQDANEQECDWALPLVKLVENIALHKMNGVRLEKGVEGEQSFILTADTLSQLLDGTIQGKPVDKNDAAVKIKAARSGSRLATAFCLDRRIFRRGQWEIDKRIVTVVTAEYVFDVPDSWLERYFKYSRGFAASNAVAVEEYGAQFFKQMTGSYSTIVGLPMFELRQALDALNFFG